MPTHGQASFDEMLTPEGAVRPAYAAFRQWYDEQAVGWLRQQNNRAEQVFRRTGITFNVYGDDAGEERLIPFDMIPRIITATEWRSGCRHRSKLDFAFVASPRGNHLQPGLLPKAVHCG
ncbi:MAG: circularly permuted type 2 ATP-grasp protein, partial [Steroidobacteraceae bacterium]